MAELGWASRRRPRSSPRYRASTERRWEAAVQEADVLLVNGGDSIYLDRWLREVRAGGAPPVAGVAVWVGLSAGSMVMAPRIDDAFAALDLAHSGDEGLGFVDFEIFPHLDNPDLPSEHDG